MRCLRGGTTTASRTVVSDAVAAGFAGAALAATDAAFAGAGFPAAGFAGATFAGSAFAGATFADAAFAGAVFAGAVFAGVTAGLSGVCFDSGLLGALGVCFAAAALGVGGFGFGVDFAVGSVPVCFLGGDAGPVALAVEVEAGSLPGLPSVEALAAPAAAGVLRLRGGASGLGGVFLGRLMITPRRRVGRPRLCHLSPHQHLSCRRHCRVRRCEPRPRRSPWPWGSQI